jgi:hypothetical protein
MPFLQCDFGHRVGRAIAVTTSLTLAVALGARAASQPNASPENKGAATTHVAAQDVVVEFRYPSFINGDNERSELLRLRHEMCLSWQNKTPRNFHVSSCTVDHCMVEVVRMTRSLADEMSAELRRTEQFEVLDVGEGKTLQSKLVENAKTAVFDTLEILRSDGSKVQQPDEHACEDVAAGILVPQLRNSRTGETVEW